MYAEVFDTYQSSESLDTFIECTDLGFGNIVIAACKDDCFTHLSFQAKHWFSNMGSTEIWNLKYRHGFAFIGKLGFKNCQEKVAINIADSVTITQIFSINPDLASYENITTFESPYAASDFDAENIYDLEQMEGFREANFTNATISNAK